MVEVACAIRAFVFEFILDSELARSESLAKNPPEVRVLSVNSLVPLFHTSAAEILFRATIRAEIEVNLLPRLDEALRIFELAARIWVDNEEEALRTLVLTPEIAVWMVEVASARRALVLPFISLVRVPNDVSVLVV